VLYSAQHIARGQRTQRALQDQAWFDAYDGKESLPTKISQNAVCIAESRRRCGSPGADCGGVTLGAMHAQRRVHIRAHLQEGTLGT
jgi:aminoglycoside/choline kinase family phosphotransferase